MGLFGNSKKQNERKKLKSKVDKLMKSYSKEKIDGDTYLKKMMDLTSSYQKKKGKCKFKYQRSLITNLNTTYFSKGDSYYEYI